MTRSRFIRSLLFAGAAALAFASPIAAAEMTEPPAAPGTAAYNAWLGRTFSDTLLNERSQEKRVKILERIVATDYIQHNPLLAQGRQGLIDFIPVIFQALPDSRFTVHDVFATADRVVTRWTWSGTLTGAPFLGIEPKGQKLEFDVIDVWRVKDGKLQEHWDQFDWPRAFVQLGVKGLPQPFYDIAALPVRR